MKVEAFETKFDIGQWIQPIGNKMSRGQVLTIKRSIDRHGTCTTYDCIGLGYSLRLNEADAELCKNQEASWY